MKERIKSNFKDFLDNFLKALNRPEMSVLPGQLAFFYVLSLVPTITLISYFASVINVSTDMIYNFLSASFSKDVAGLLLSSSSSATGIGFIIAICIGYYIASNGAASVIVTSNTIYGIDDGGFFKRRLKAIFMTLIIVILFSFILIVPVFGNKIIELLTYVKFYPTVTNNVIHVIEFIQGPLAWIIVYLFIRIIYSISLNIKVKGKNVRYGAIFTSVSWILITNLYSYYVTHIANFGALYGSLANIVLLMLWFYFLAFVFTVGIAMNYSREEALKKIAKNGTLKKKK